MMMSGPLLARSQKFEFYSLKLQHSHLFFVYIASNATYVFHTWCKVTCEVLQLFATNVKTSVISSVESPTICTTCLIHVEKKKGIAECVEPFDDHLHFF